MSWKDPKKVEKLKELWGKGNTASQIAEIIGGISRNAVIGKAHRLNLSAKIKGRNFSKNQSINKINSDENGSENQGRGRKSKFKSLLIENPTKSSIAINKSLLESISSGAISNFSPNTSIDVPLKSFISEIAVSPLS